MAPLKMCFPPTRRKKKAYKESCIVQSVLLENPGKYISTSIFQPGVIASSDTIEATRLSFVQRSLSKASEWFYQRVTRSWDRGDPSALTPAELERLMKRYYYVEASGRE